MPTVTLTQTINRPITDPFAIVTDVTTFPQWNPTTVSATKLTDGPIGEGTRYQVAIRGFGKQELELRDYEEGRRVRLVPHSKMLAGGHLFDFHAQGDHTRIDHELVMQPKGILKLMSPFMGAMARKNLNDTATALQRHLETRA